MTVENSKQNLMSIISLIINLKYFDRQERINLSRFLLDNRNLSVSVELGILDFLMCLLNISIQKNQHKQISL